MKLAIMLDYNLFEYNMFVKAGPLAHWGAIVPINGQYYFGSPTRFLTF